MLCPRAGLQRQPRSGRQQLDEIRRATNGHRTMVAPAAQGVKMWLAVEAAPPGVGPPAITYIRPPTTAAPRPRRTVGIAAWLLQPSRSGSQASISSKVPAMSSPPTSMIRSPSTAAAMPLRTVVRSARVCQIGGGIAGFVGVQVARNCHRRGRRSQTDRRPRRRPRGGRAASGSGRAAIHRSVVGSHASCAGVLRRLRGHWINHDILETRSIESLAKRKFRDAAARDQERFGRGSVHRSGVLVDWGGGRWAS
jgi:hypothetical protein